MREAFRICGAAALVLAVGPACNTEVTNPGRVADDFVSNVNAAAALVNGAGRATSEAMNYIGYTGAAVTREIHPAGSTGSFGITNLWQYGALGKDDRDLNIHWNNAQRARWLAEEAVRRLEALPQPLPTEAVQSPSQFAITMQLAYLWAGFANRLLGENMCDAVVDGGPKTVGVNGRALVYFQRAESLFTKAIGVVAPAGATAAQIATIASQATAGYGGRASVRAFTNNWAGATADAALVTTATFAFNMPFYNVGDDDQRNRIFYSSGNTRESGSAYRAHTQWNTWHLQYKYGVTTLTASTPAVTTDSRISIAISSQPLGDAAIDCCGRVPFYPEAKHVASASPMRLTGWREMRLIEAESFLVAGDMTNGMAKINQARTNAGAPAITAVDITDAWRLLKRDRGIELWLESRRLGDLRRWKADNRPGALDPLESIGTGVKGAPSYLTTQDLCYPIPPSERETNPGAG